MVKLSADQHLVILGMGVAGVTLAKHIRNTCNCRITLISDEHQTHFSRPALMYVFLGHMRRQDIEPYEEWWWKENKLERVFGRAEKIDFNSKNIILSGEKNVAYDVLVIASGSVPKFYNWPGQDLKGVQGFVRLADLQLLEENTKQITSAVIVGGGLIGVELAEMLRSRNIQVNMLVREELYWKNILPAEEANLITTHIKKHGINLIFKDELSEIIPGEAGKVKAVKTKSGKEIPCQFVGIATGVKPNISFLKNTSIKTDSGILVNRFFKTSQKNVFAIGDCAQFNEPEKNGLAIEQLWYTARLHAENLAKTLTGKPEKYSRGPWFNSAKFFDLEYQTYSFVPAEFSDDLLTISWQDLEHEKLIRLVYQKSDLTFVGVNALGIRLRHDLFHFWLQNQVSITEVLSQLQSVSFQEEFSKTNLNFLIDQFNQLHPEKPIKSRKNNWWKIRSKVLAKISASL